ncbi:uncharacterized protein PRCAT00005192001 [Priceomyces carsonii]|uniref:uncharacterized protein n=1 Tax=Priceomyces carsonii TaxID=28549 RepID=UPI002EDB96E6|nr:unnamed protein product [Priceomyces carsonii]
MPEQRKRSTHGGKGHSGNFVKRRHGNSGRQEMRSVTRTSRRDRRPEDGKEDAMSDEEDAIDGIEQNEKEDLVDSRTADSNQTYSALLTLLKADHLNTIGSERKKGEALAQADDKEPEDEIAGLNVEASDEEEDEGAIDDMDEEEQNGRDPYETHFNLATEDYVETEVKLIESHHKWPLKSKKSFPEIGYDTIFQTPPGTSLPSDAVDFRSKASLDDYLIKKRVSDAFTRHFPAPLTMLETRLVDPLLSYKDMLLPYGNCKNNSYRKFFVMHALNHVFKTRDRILKNNTKIRDYKESTKSGRTEEEPEFKDQGFTRPKVLILLPTRDSCNEIVNLLINLSGSEQQENKKKFNLQFSSNVFPPDTKPEDFRDAFKGNNNDFFCIGIKFTRKTLKLYSSFYSSDIILASPIGLTMILENPDKKKRQYDFLSSIEILIVDRAHQIEMQNWDHVNTVLKYLNKVPKDFHGADFSRIRMWSINDRAKFLRQTLVFTEYATPSTMSVVSSKSYNLAGKLKFRKVFDSKSCIMNSIGLKVKQIFQRFECPSPVEDPEARFKFFINSILPSLMKSVSYDDGLLIFIPSYYDYLRVKNFLKTSTKYDFGSIDEYSSQSKLSKTRHQFLSGKIKILLYTERLHYFRRFELAGVKNMLLYGLPSNPLFYKELVRFLGRSIFKEIADKDLSFVKVLYSKWDNLSLERIVGSDRMPVLCNSVNEIYEFK